MGARPSLMDGPVLNRYPHLSVQDGKAASPAFGVLYVISSVSCRRRRFHLPGHGGKDFQVNATTDDGVVQPRHLATSAYSGRYTTQLIL